MTDQPDITEELSAATGIAAVPTEIARLSAYLIWGKENTHAGVLSNFLLKLVFDKIITSI